LTLVKARADAERIIFRPMSTSRSHAFRVSTAMKWRRALVAALMLLVGFAPVAKAACDVEALAAHLGGAGTISATSPHAPHPHDDEGTCCDHEPAAFVAQAKPPAADGASVLTPAGAHAALADGGRMARTAYRAPTSRRYPAAPPEPVFRRVPRLLR
jgi:hypothetical protein